MSRSLMDVTPEEILVWGDKVEEEGLLYVEPRAMLIGDLAFPRWLSDPCKAAFKSRLPHIDAWIEGKPIGRWNLGLKAKRSRLQHYQCEHRPVQLFVRSVLERLLTLLDVTNLERHCCSPLWYISVVTDPIDPKIKWKELTERQGDKGQYHYRV